MTPKTFLIGQGFAVFVFQDHDGTAEASRLDPGLRTPILIGPGKAFGSGEHETTSSVLEELEKFGGLEGKSVFDLGTGTGILSIAAVKLGAREVTAVDPEDGAVESAGRNAVLNGIGDRVKVIKGDISSALALGLRFDLILANLYGDLLLGLAPHVRRLTVTGGRVILSGMTYEYSSDVKTAFVKAGFEMERSRALENFCTFVMKAL